MTTLAIQGFLCRHRVRQQAFTLATQDDERDDAVALHLLVAACGLKLAWTGRTYAGQPARARRRTAVVGLLATLYAAAMLLAGGAKFLAAAALLYARRAPNAHGDGACASREQRLSFCSTARSAVRCSRGVAAARAPLPRARRALATGAPRESEPGRYQAMNSTIAAARISRRRLAATVRPAGQRTTCGRRS